MICLAKSNFPADYFKTGRCLKFRSAKADLFKTTSCWQICFPAGSIRGKMKTLNFFLRKKQCKRKPAFFEIIYFLLRKQSSTIQHVWKALPPVEWLPGKYQNCIQKPERGEQLCRCDSGLWRWPAGGGTQGDLGSIKSFLPGHSQEEQAFSSTDLREKCEIRAPGCYSWFSVFLEKSMSIRKILIPFL